MDLTRVENGTNLEFGTGRDLWMIFGRTRRDIGFEMELVYVHIYEEIGFCGTTISEWELKGS